MVLADPVEQPGAGELVAQVLLEPGQREDDAAPVSSARSDSMASAPVTSTSTLASTLSRNHRTGTAAASTAASARVRKFSALAKNSGES